MSFRQFINEKWKIITGKTYKEIQAEKTEKMQAATATVTEPVTMSSTTAYSQYVAYDVRGNHHLSDLPSTLQCNP